MLVTNVTSISTVFERFCVYSRKRIEMPVAVCTRIDRCISVDRAQIGNSNVNGKKAIDTSKTTTMHANHAFFVHFYAVTCSTATTCRNYLISRLVESMNTRQRCCLFFVTLKQSFRIQLQKTSPTFGKLNGME